jgi:biopolymer transport protein ExbD
MPIKQPQTDDVQMNMTPMIDIVFNLVTFFMLAVDISHKDFVNVALPRAHAGVEDKDPSTLKPEEQYIRFNIALKQNGAIVFKGREWYLEDVPQPDGGPPRPQTPEGQHAALEGLKSALREQAGSLSDKSRREPDQSSKVVILIRGDRDARWKYVQWIMQVAADPTIRIYKMHFAVEAPPKDRPQR